MQLSSVIAALGAAAVAILALVTLRDQRPTDPDSAEEEELVTASGS